MSKFTLTVKEFEFYTIAMRSERIILRDKDYAEADLGRRLLLRNRPSRGDLAEVRHGGYAFVFPVRETVTVQIYLDDDHPLWVDGELLTHAEQEVFADHAGYKNWNQFADEMFARYGYNFDGYAVRL